MHLWYFLDNAEQLHGPVEESEFLRRALEGEFTRDTPVSCPTRTEVWTRLRQVPILMARMCGYRSLQPNQPSEEPIAVQETAAANIAPAA